MKGEKRFLAGLAAVAEAAKLADVDVISSFPIRPYTGLMVDLSLKVANGELDAEFVHAEGEHGQLAIVHGASASGARTMTGSSGVGVTYAFETYSPISGGRCPVQMVIADRTLDPPGDFGSEHSDVLCARDQGWIMGWAETPQEALDNTLIYYRLGEDKRVALPQFNCQDGYFVSHIPGDVVVPEQSQVNEFLPPYKLDKPLDPLRPYGHGPQIYSDQGPVLELQRAIVMDKAKEIIPGIMDDFKRIFGRKYDPFIEDYNPNNAEVCLFINGAHAHTARYAIANLKSQGVNLALCKLRFVRPWATDEIAEALSRYKVVGVIETNNSFGVAREAGVFTPEVAATLYSLPENKRPLLISFMAGLGGEAIRLKDFYFMAKKLMNTAQRKKIEKPVYWIGFEEDEEDLTF